MSTGQLINRALSDLQNVRAFIQTAVLTTLEIVLIVILNILLIVTINGWNRLAIPFRADVGSYQPGSAENPATAVVSA